MKVPNISENAEACLRGVGIRPTRQRIALAELIRDGGHRHLTPDSVHQEAATAGMRLSLATVYNTLHEFAAAGLIRRVAVGERSWFCTNTQPHHHFYDEATSRLHDITGDQPTVANVPPPPPGMVISGVDVIVRVRRLSA